MRNAQAQRFRQATPSLAPQQGANPLTLASPSTSSAAIPNSAAR
jgi:hypothetical protein